MPSLPYFKYNPNAEKLGILALREATCPVCQQFRSIIYDGPVASENDVADICPWCIADGSAAEKFDCEFAGSAGTEDVDDEEALRELLTRTPGFNTFQEVIWPAHCGAPCAYMNPVGNKEVKRMREELIDDIEHLADEFGIDEEELIDDITTDGAMQGHLFNCLHCGQHRLVIDME